MSKLFGKAPTQVPSQSVSGFEALPGDLQQRFRDLGAAAGPLLDNPAQFFAPQDISAEEESARGIINSSLDPQAFRESIEGFLSPYRGIVTEDINKAFEGPQGALAARASEAGAFGSSRHRSGEADLDRGRLDAIANALNNEYGRALGQRQQSISNLMGFGGLERGIDLAQRSALPQAINTFSSALSPLLSGSQTTGSFTQGGSQGLLGKIGQAASFAAPFFTGGLSLPTPAGVNPLGTGSAFTGMSALSDERLKKNITKVGEKKGLNVYEYEYLWSPKKWIGYMAQEVEKLYPNAIGEYMGYKTVDYGAI